MMTWPGLGPILEGPGEKQAEVGSSASSAARSGEVEARPPPTPPTSASITDTSTQDDDLADARRRRELEAATAIQRRWKGHKARAEHAEVKLCVASRHQTKPNGATLLIDLTRHASPRSSDERWKQLLFNAEGVKRNEDADQGKVRSVD